MYSQKEKDRTVKFFHMKKKIYSWGDGSVGSALAIHENPSLDSQNSPESQATKYASVNVSLDKQTYKQPCLASLAYLVRFRFCETPMQTYRRT